MGPIHYLWGLVATAMLVFSRLAEASLDECEGVVVSDALSVLVEPSSIMTHLQTLQSYANKGNGSRAAGSYGHNLTIQYIQNHLKSQGYYVEVQPFYSLMQVQSAASLTIGDQSIRVEPVAWSPGFSAEFMPIQVVDNAGCRAIDYPTSTFGGIALVHNGGCSVSDKSKAAQDAGAKALLLRESTELSPSLGGLDDRHIASARISERDAQVIDDLPRPLWATNMDIFTKFEEVKSDESNTLLIGTHTDSSSSSAGMNDNASGIASLLEIASRLVKFKTNSMVKFAFWTASEPDLLGSRHWIDTQHDEDLNKIRLYLDVNMIGSPNGALKVYDGRGISFKTPAPNGSGNAEKVLEDGFHVQGIKIGRAEMSNRSDYAAFFEAQIPFSGLFSGADGFKTQEEFSMFGGEMDKPYDTNYHQSGDNLNNINTTALLINTKALAHAVGTYGRGFDSFPAKPIAGENDALKGALCTTDAVVITIVLLWFVYVGLLPNIR